MDDQARPGTAQDTAAMVWDLVEGFALLSTQLADRFPGQQATTLEVVLRRMADRAEAIGKADLAARLNHARGRFGDMLAPD